MKLFTLLISFFTVALLQAEPVYLCQRTLHAPTIDGHLDESEWQQAMPLSALRTLETRAPALHTATIRMMYDDTALYIAAVLPEKHLHARQTQRDSIIYHDPDFEVFIDPTATGKNYLELELNALNTVWDLFLTAPYREGGIALHDWNIPGLKTAVSYQGTLNNDQDEDQSWTVEIAWPWASITGHSTLPREGHAPASGTEMRFNFSRVDHSNNQPFGTPGYTEENSVWASTGQATIHAPEHWGRVRFSAQPVGTPETFPPSVFLWVHGNDNKLTPHHFEAWAKEGITSVIIDGSPARVEELATWAKATHLETIAWVWALNQPDAHEPLQHPDWFAVSREGRSCFAPADRPFVPYYQFLCPTHPEVRTYLRKTLHAYAVLPHVDALQLDYIRMPDVILPQGLWRTYGLDMSTELAPYDFCYCKHCLEAFGDTPTPGNANWREFRLNQIAAVANLLVDEAHAAGKRCGAAVFPTPKLAAKLVRQDWSRFNLDFAFPMDYASFYEANTDWILTQVKEAQAAIDGRFPIYPGLHLPDFTVSQLNLFLPELLRINPHGYARFSHDSKLKQ